MYDLKLLPLKLDQGQQEFVSLGFTASAPPRRASRSRSEDMLILSLSFKGDDQTASEIQKSWLDNLIQSFFKTGGSVTSAMRTLIETLNLTLMEKNLKSGRDAGPTAAAINLAAIHRRVLYIAQSGFTHAFVLNQQGLAHFYDSSRSDRGLGFLINIGRGQYDTALVFVAVITLSAMAMALYSIVLLIETRLLSWQSWRDDAL